MAWSHLGAITITMLTFLWNLNKHLLKFEWKCTICIHENVFEYMSSAKCPPFNFDQECFHRKPPEYKGGRSCVGDASEIITSLWKLKKFRGHRQDRFGNYPKVPRTSSIMEAREPPCGTPQHVENIGSRSTVIHVRRETLVGHFEACMAHDLRNTLKTLADKLHRENLVDHIF